MLCYVMLFCVGCSNAIKVGQGEKYTTYQTKKDLEFVGVKNSDKISNEFGYSYLVANLGTAFEEQRLMEDKSGFLADEITLSNLREYSTNHRYIVFGEVKNYETFMTENKEDVSGAEHLLYGVYTLGIGNLIAETYANTNRLTYLQFKLSMNFYVYDKKTNKVIKRIPVEIEDLTALEGSWKDTKEEDQNKIMRNYLIRIFNMIGDQLVVGL